LSQKSGESVVDGGVTYANLHQFLIDTVEKLPNQIPNNSHHEVHTTANVVSEEQSVTATAAEEI